MVDMFFCAADGVNVSEIPKEIKLLPLGLVKTQKGDFIVDEESFDLIQRQFKERKLDIVIDYEHQTLQDVQAPAGGWIKELYLGSDAICAKVEWTPKAADYLKMKEYRYLSPVVMVRKSDRKAISLHSAALTNKPAIDGMFALVNSLNINDKENNDSKGGRKMEWKELATLLGLPESATEEEIREALQKVTQAEALKSTEERTRTTGTETAACSTAVADTTILSLLGLNESASVADVSASIMSLKAGGVDTQKELLALKEKLQKKDAQDSVDKAMKDGKITAAQKEWALAYALKDQEGFNSFIEKAPTVVPQGRMELKDAPEQHFTEDAVTMEILKNCDLSIEDAKKYFKEDAR